jgi:hypothetical protein
MRHYHRGLAVLTLLLSVLLALSGRLVQADGGAQLSFTLPHSASGWNGDNGNGAASATWLVSFQGFGNDEVLELSFTAPDGTQAAVGDDVVFTASSQDDGTGVFNFVPAAWLSPLEAGSWQVTAVGQQSGRSASTSFTLTQ